MKGSKKFGKSILVIALSLVLIISAVAPMTVMGSENYGASNGTSLGSYRYYSVKSGDTLASIASKNGITVSDIMTYNNLDSTDTLYRGQILKLPVTSNNSTNSIVSSRISVKAKESNVKDLVSSIAYNAGYTVIYCGSGTETVTVDLENVTPLKALDYVTRLVNLSYLKDGNTILVSTASDLNSTFVDSLVLTKFTFKYITYNELLTQASALGLSDMKTVSQSQNQRDVWISAYPKEMAKLAELVKILDAPENISVGSNSIAAAFTPIELDYITASEFSSLLSNLGLHAGITMSSRPMTLFVYVSGVALSDIMTIKKVVDTEAVLTEGNNVGSPVINPDGTTDDTANDTTDNTTDDSTATPPADDSTTTTTPEETPVEEPIVYEKIELVNISRSDAESLIAKYTEGISTYGHERMTKSLWLFGTATNIANAKAIISEIDSNVASAASTVHTYVAQNCTVDELMSRLNGADYENVGVYTYDHSSLTNSIIVYCDDVTWNNEILPLLEAVDNVNTGDLMWLPLDSTSSISKDDAQASLQDRLNVMIALYPNVFDGVDYRFESIVESVNEGLPTYKVVTYVKTTSDKLTRMKSLLEALDNA